MDDPESDPPFKRVAFDRYGPGRPDGAPEAHTVRPLLQLVHFPLSDWIDSHADCRYQLGKSGMVGVIEPPRPTPRQLRRRTADEWTDELRRVLADHLRVDPSRLFLTHGASEANSWVMFFTAREARSGSHRCRVQLPEYPPLLEVARLAGFRPHPSPGRVPLALVSLPRNPEGVGWTSQDLSEWADGARTLLVDETFREFSGRPSRAEAGDRGVWTTGSFTKFYGADSLRVGFAVAPPEAAEEFGRFHAAVADDLPPASAAAAVDLLNHWGPISRRVRSLFDRNRTALRRALPAVPSLDAPVYFDRDPNGDGDRLANRCLRASVLVCPGSLFGAPEGVRICLTRPTFPADLEAYLEVRGGADRPATAAGATARARRRRGDTVRARAATS
ncbi:MAG TPA: pyridoxal phosphate-dependent aminotransferase [Thermoplasmata archaeon]|nr:pyridoxal phosphate-dependent aminotransferase [Thermoplasmata archaeon]